MGDATIPRAVVWGAGQYVSIRYTECLAEVGASASAGSVADSYDCQSLGTGSRKDRGAPAVTV